MANRHPGTGNPLEHNRRQLSKLEKALADQPADVVLRVRDYAHTFDLDEDDELFAFAAALGLVTILIQEAPEKVSALFDQMRLELEDWAQQNRRSFHQLEGYTDTANQLAVTLEKTIAAVNNASGSRNTTRQEILNAIDNSDKHHHQLEKEMKERLNRLERQLFARLDDQLFERLDEQLVTLKDMNQLKTVIAGACCVGVFSGLVVGTIFALQLTYQNDLLRTALARQKTEIDWLVKKANRAECHYGIKPPDDPQCLPFQ